MHMVTMMSEWLRIQNMSTVKERSASAGEPIEKEGNGRDKHGIGVKFGGKRKTKNTFQRQQGMMTAL